MKMGCIDMFKVLRGRFISLAGFWVFFCLFFGVSCAYSSDMSVDSFSSLSDPIPSLWTYYIANVSSELNKTVV
jgi:hypothetical protein